MMTASSMADAVVIGSGPNGLVAANVLADAGWSVVVYEAAPEPGGAVRSAELTLPGHRHDVFSSFYPFAAGSPVMQRLHLEDHGLRWVRSPLVVGHPVFGQPSAVLSMDRDVTAASLDRFAPGDGGRWSTLLELWDRAGDQLLDALLTPFPPVRPAARLAGALGPRGTRRFVRDALLSSRRMGEEYFRGEGGRLLLNGLALHSDLPPEAAGSGLFGWLLAALGDRHGFPVPEGGAQELTNAMVRRLERLGGTVVCDARVDRVQIRNGVAVGVEIAGTLVPAGRAVIADVAATSLYGQLVRPDQLPPRVLSGMKRFQLGSATVKVDWALEGNIPWTDPQLNGSGTVHLAESVDELSVFAQELATGRLPAKPFLLLGQMTSTDPTRSPAGTETVWAYTHVPQVVRADAAGVLRPDWCDQTRLGFVERMEDQIERHAPGFRDRIRGRHILAPPDFQTWNENLEGGDLMGGTAQLHQQLIFRPIPGWSRAETAIGRLYLGSASAHPGGGVHGGPGSNAARAALAHDAVRRVGSSLRRALHR